MEKRTLEYHSTRFLRRFRSGAAHDTDLLKLLRDIERTARREAAEEMREKVWGCRPQVEPGDGEARAALNEWAYRIRALEVEK